MKGVVIGLAAVVCLGAGCSRHDTPKRPVGTAHWQIGFSAAPKQPRQLDPAQLRVQVTHSRNKPVSGAAVTAGLVMPAMDMGRNVVTLHETTALGTYTGTGRFTMPGDWEAAVTADKGASHQSQTFPVSVR